MTVSKHRPLLIKQMRANVSGLSVKGIAWGNKPRERPVCVGRGGERKARDTRTGYLDLGVRVGTVGAADPARRSGWPRGFSESSTAEKGPQGLS